MVFRSLRAAADKMKALAGASAADRSTYSGGPDYMMVGADELTARYGEALAARVFSEEFTEQRLAAIMQTVPQTDEFGWAVYDLYPHTLESGAPSWIERYLVSAGSETKRGLILWLEDEGLQMAHLIPGETLADVRLQCDALETVLLFVLGQAGRENQADFTFNPALAALGIPDVWPDDCGATLYDTAILAVPNDEGTSWSERWGLNVGGEDVIVDIDFVAAPDGGTLVMPRMSALPDQR